IVEKPSEVVPPIASAGSLGVIAAAGLPSAFDLLAMVLIVAAIVVFWLPTMVILALFSGKSWLAARYSDLYRLALVGLVCAVMELILLSLLRSGAEQMLGLP